MNLTLNTPIYSKFANFIDDEGINTVTGNQEKYGTSVQLLSFMINKKGNNFLTLEIFPFTAWQHALCKKWQIFKF